MFRTFLVATMVFVALLVGCGKDKDTFTSTVTVGSHEVAVEDLAEDKQYRFRDSDISKHLINKAKVEDVQILGGGLCAVFVHSNSGMSFSGKYGVLASCVESKPNIGSDVYFRAMSGAFRNRDEFVPFVITQSEAEALMRVGWKIDQ